MSFLMPPIAMICPSCLSGGLGPAYLVAFAICGLFFVAAALVLFWASRNGRLDGLEDTKYKMLQDDD
jgi:nitrogen fixation-related uncharacterized protein